VPSNPSHPALEPGSRVPVTYRPPEDVKERLRASVEQGRSVGSILTEALRQHFADGTVAVMPQPLPE
jgi:hypothetical protein